ncbi:hypothetical protein [Ideonella paludis]|uniref:hypothetical protein n=1 Tax=Ideonella paludis TaxID=1233411 RepID=UPI003624C688
MLLRVQPSPQPPTSRRPAPCTPPPALDVATRHLLRTQALAEAHRLRQQALQDAGDALWQAATGAAHAAQRAATRLQARLRAHAKLRQRLTLG